MPKENKHLQKIELRSEEVQEILTRVPHWMIRWGNVLFLCLIMLLLSISWFVKYPDIITGNAILTTNIPPQKEYAKVTAKLQYLLVDDNTAVLKNTPIAILENTANYKDIFYLKRLIDTIKVNNKDFNFPIDSMPMLFLGDVETPFALFENSYIQYRLNKDLDPFQYENQIGVVTASELKLRLQTLQSQRSLYASEMKFKKKDLARYHTLFKKGVIAAQEHEKKQLEYLQAQRNYKNINSSISQMREQVNTNEKTNIGNSINQTRQEIKLLKDVIQSFNQLKNSITNWELQYIFQSKIAGTVSFLKYWTVNQTVNVRDLVCTVIPTEHKGFIVKAKVPSLNSGKLKIGQKVHIKLQNYPETEFGMLVGTVKTISSIPDSEGFYLLDIRLNEDTLITTYKKELIFKQEMLASVEVITEDLRLLERFFYQFREILKRE